jgi:hypothetical protein
MKLNPYSWHAWVYRYTYGGWPADLPKSLCVYFWKLVVAIVLTVAGYPGLILKIWLARNDHDHGMMFPLLGITLNVLALGAGHDALKKNYTLIEQYGMGMLALVILALCCLTVWGIFCIGQAISNYFASESKPSKIKPISPKKSYILFEYSKAFFNKYCPTIQWKQSSSSSPESPSDSSSES